MLTGIVEYRELVADAVRRERRERGSNIGLGIDFDVSIFWGLQSTVEEKDSYEHRRLACEAKAELWRNIRAGEVDNDSDGPQVFEEWSHTE